VTDKVTAYMTDKVTAYVTDKVTNSVEESRCWATSSAESSNSAVLYRTRKIITVFAKAHEICRSRASLIQFTPLPLISVLIFEGPFVYHSCIYARSSKWFFPSAFPTEALQAPLLFPVYTKSPPPSPM
jgi:hypothetical protein